MLQQTVSENVVSTWGLHTLRQITEAEGVVSFSLSEVQLREWKLVNFIEHRVAPLADPGEQGSIRVEVPVSGLFFPAFILFDGYSDDAQEMEILVNGEHLGIAVADARDNNQKLFALGKPVDFRAGDVFELRNLNTNGRYIVEGLFLLPRLFESRLRSFEISEISARVVDNQHGLEASVTFITSWATAPKITWGLVEDLEQDARVTASAGGVMPLNNHRALLRELLPDATYYFRVEAPSPDGTSIVSQVHQFSTAGVSYPSAIKPPRQVAFKLSRTIPPGSVWPVTGGIPLPQAKFSWKATSACLIVLAIMFPFI